MVEPQLSRQIPSLDVLCLTHVAGGGGGTKGPGRRGKTESRVGRKAGPPLPRSKNWYWLPYIHTCTSTYTYNLTHTCVCNKNLLSSDLGKHNTGDGGIASSISSVVCNQFRN